MSRMEGGRTLTGPGVIGQAAAVLGSPVFAVFHLRGGYPCHRRLAGNRETEPGRQGPHWCRGQETPQETLSQPKPPSPSAAGVPESTGKPSAALTL
jgi:hypothetical protein